jgi:hypothetical protein
MILTMNNDYFFKSSNQLVFAMDKYCVFFDVRTECLNINYVFFQASERFKHW